MRYIDLGKLVGRSEVRHWKRMRSMISAINGIPAKIISGGILVVLISFSHWIFMCIHVCFETWLYLTNRKQFDKNIKEGLRI